MLGVNGIKHIVHGNIIALKLFSIEPDPHGRICVTTQNDITDTGNNGEAIFQIVFGVTHQKIRIVFLIGDSKPNDRLIIGIGF
ncbi:hypothetical protein D3C87_1613800 [compost metagenome]